MSGGYSSGQYLSPDITNGSTYHLEVGATEEAGPDVACKAFMVKAMPDNTDNVYFNWKTGVKADPGADDALGGFPLDAGQDSPWFPSGGNLSNVYFIGGAAGQGLVIVYLT